MSHNCSNTQCTHSNRVGIIAVHRIPEAELNSLIFLTVFKLKILTTERKWNVLFSIHHLDQNLTHSLTLSSSCANLSLVSSSDIDSPNDGCG